MAFAIKCKTCGKISKRNYILRSKATLVSKTHKDFEKCSKEEHKIAVEKVY